MEEIRKILPGAFRAHVRRADSRLLEILVPLWPQIVGKYLAQHCRPVAFETGTLTLAADSLSWHRQVAQLGEEMRAAINSFMGWPVVKRLRVERTPTFELPQAQARPEKVQPADEPQGLERIEGGAKLDPEMAQTVERSFTKYFARHTRKVH